jgi:predicted enzyme related to lactoylglutathione lyase
LIALADCAVTVANANEAARWWKEKLGFAVHTVGSGSHAVMVAPPKERFVLHLCEGFAPVEPGNSGIAFVTDDIDGMVRGMLAKGVQFPEPLTKESGGGMAKFSDPDGNIFWLLGASTAFIRQQVGRRDSADRRSRSKAGGRRNPTHRRRPRK